MSITKDFVIENGVLIKYIGAGGDVVIPVGVAEIAASAFNPYLDGIAIKHYDGRKNIKSVVIPEGVVKIGKSAFANCENLKTITAPQSLTKVEANAFFRTAWQEKQNGFITLNSVLVAYSGDDSKVIIPEGITAIADGVFESHREITSVQIPQTVTSIGSQAFCRCEALREIHIPENVTEIGHLAFDITPWLEARTEDFVIINNILYKYQGQNAIVPIPDTIHMIGSYAFGFHKTVESVTIPDSGMQIKASAFSGCKKLKSVAIPAGIEELENNVFFGCNNLTEIFCSGDLKRIGTSTFYGCEKLTQFPDMTGVESIGEEAFFGCQMLADQKGRIIVNGILLGYDNPGRIIEIPNEVSYISSGAFEDTKYAFVNTEEVELIVAPEAVFAQVWGLLKPANKQAVALNCLKNDTLYEPVKAYIKKGKDKLVPEIIRCDDGAMMECLFSLIKNPDLDTVEKYIVAASGKVNVSAFLLDYKAKNFTEAKVEKRHEEKTEMDLGLRERKLKNWKEIFKLSVKDGCVRISGYKQNEPVIEIPEIMEGNPVTVIGDYAFKGNTTVEQVVLPDGITSIGSSAFKGCAKLKCINIPNGVEEISMSAFEDCAELQSIDLPDSIQMIWANAFKGCTNLEKVRLPGNLNKISLGLFDGCAAIKEIYLPDSITAIYDYSFRDCKVLAAVNMPANLEVIGQGVFTNCRAITEIVLPDNVKTIETYAFRNCTKLAKIRIPANTKNLQPSAFNGCKKLTIYAPAGSKAASVAKKEKIPFVAE